MSMHLNWRRSSRGSDSRAVTLFCRASQIWRCWYLTVPIRPPSLPLAHDDVVAAIGIRMPPLQRPKTHLVPEPPRCHHKERHAATMPTKQLKLQHHHAAVRQMLEASEASVMYAYPYARRESVYARQTWLIAACDRPADVARQATAER